MKSSIQFIQNELKGIFPNDESKVFAELIFKHLFNFTRTDYMLNQNRILSGDEILEVEKIVGRLKKQEPFQYITGVADFYGLTFNVNPSTLIPRPETEELVHWIINDNKNKAIKILDIGTGSGCIAISLAANLPHASVYATDVSSLALETARTNALKNNVDVKFFESDILNFAANETLMGQRFDLIVSNPPYVRECEMKDMMPNVLDYEPSLALFVSDHDPLVFYRTIAQYAKSQLSSSGQLYYEINEYLPAEMGELLTGMEYKNIEIRKDINDRYRMLKANKN